MKIKKLNKNLGFSLVELTITLVVFGAIVLITTQIIEQVNVKKNINAQKAVITAYENSVIKQINANYDSIYSLASKNSNQQLIYTYDNFNDYALTGSNPTDLLYQSFFKPCVLIKADTARNTLSAALIYPANQNILKNSAALSSELGNASFLSTDKWIGNIATNYFTSQNIQSLANSCNSNINSFKTGSIFIDLNKNSSMISRKTNITDNSTNNGTNETLKNNGDSNSYNKSIGTNLYFDAIVKESSAWSTNYCDSTKANQALLTQQCQNYANSTGLRFDGMQQIASINMIGGTCQIQAKANFSTLTACSPPNTTATTTATGICQSQHPNNYNYVGPTQYNYYTSTPTGGLCKANFQAKFSKQITSGTCKTYEYTIGYGGGQWGRATCSAGGVYHYPGNCGYTGGTAACDGVTKNGETGWYGTCRGAVQLGPYNCANAGCAGKDWTCIEYDTTTDYQNYQCATNVSYSADYGASTTMNCGAVYNDSNAYQTNSGVSPPQHKFKSLSFGDKGSGNILVKSGTADGTSTESDTYLNIQKAGVKSGYILLRSKAIAADSACKSSELGKMIQQQDESTNYTTSQLVCSYDLDFCGGNGYCYTPLVSQSQFVDKPNSYSISCPAGLRVDVSWNPTVANGGLSYEKCYSGTTQLNVSINQLQSGKKVTGLSTTCQTANGTPLNYLNRIKCVSSSTEKILTGCKGGDNATCQ